MANSEGIDAASGNGITQPQRHAAAPPLSTPATAKARLLGTPPTAAGLLFNG